jgi:dTDP-4-amino-4,6-dideoxygalactose transaminase
MTASAGNWKVSLSDIDLGPDEEAAVVEVLRSKWLTMGARTAEFERQFGAAVGARHAIAVSNCTAALHLALAAAGVSPGDEVIVPSLTFVATANAVLYCGATPVFADVTSETRLSLDPEDVARKITARTRAIVPVHYAGYACDMDALGALARTHGLALVDDAAHAPGTRWRTQPVGSIGDITCFSFFSNKNLSTGEGGMVTTNDDAIAAKVRLNRSHGMTTLTYDRHRGHAFSYDVVSAGYNYRMTELNAALGIVQLAKLERNNARRRSLVGEYRRRLAGIASLIVPFAGMDDESSCHIMPVVLPQDVDRTAVQQAMKEAGIQTSIHYPPVHGFTNFAGRFAADVPRVDALASRLLTLPLHPLMSVDDVAAVCGALRDGIHAASSVGASPQHNPIAN